MSQTLYRKYRPQKFSELIGQNHIKVTLQNEIISQNIAHAYLFSGPRGTGKTTIARLLAKSLNCQNRSTRDFEPCGKCQSCQEIAQGKSLDLIEIDAASHTGVDNVRENIIESVRFAPYRDKFKVFIIDEAHMLSVSAFNALLKTLEEPPQHAVFILCTTELYKLPETIISRCQRFDFKKIDLKILTEYLEQISRQEGFEIDQTIYHKIALNSGGFVRDALSLLGQVLSLGKKKISLNEALAILPRSDYQAIVSLVDNIIQNQLKIAIEKLNELVDVGVDLEQFTLDLIGYLRHLALIKLKTSHVSYLEIDQTAIRQAAALNLDQISNILQVFIHKLPAVKNAEISQLPLEIALIELCETKKDKTDLSAGSSISLTPTDPKLKPKSSLQEDARRSKDKDSAKEAVGSPQDKPKKKTNFQQTTAPADGDKETNPGSLVVSLQEINDKWPTIIAGSKAVNHSVAVALETAIPTNLEDNNLEISFAHSFYCERFKEVKSRRLIEQVLKKTLNCDLVVKVAEMSPKKKAEFAQARQTKEKQAKEKLDDLAAEFGGKIVE